MYRRFEVEVEGGALTVGLWGDGDHIVLASHGITANHLSWQRVGELLDDGDVSLVAVDHRGRAGSASVPGPYGLAAHADDLVAVLDHLDAASAVFTGHSMGAFVCALAAERHPARIDRVVLIDGGLALPVDAPADADVETIVQAVIGPALERLDQRWPDVDAYVDFFRVHPAFEPPNQFSATTEAYVRYDAVHTDAGEVRSSVSKDAVLVDGGAAIVDPHSSTALYRMSAPTTLLWAPRGILDRSPGLFGHDQVDAAVAELDHLDAALVPDTNHYTILVGEEGAAAVAAALATTSQA